MCVCVCMCVCAYQLISSIVVGRKGCCSLIVKLTGHSYYHASVYSTKLLLQLLCIWNAYCSVSKHQHAPILHVHTTDTSTHTQPSTQRVVEASYDAVEKTVREIFLTDETVKMCASHIHRLNALIRGSNATAQSIPTQTQPQTHVRSRSSPIKAVLDKQDAVNNAGNRCYLYTIIIILVLICLLLLTHFAYTHTLICTSLVTLSLGRTEVMSGMLRVMCLCCAMNDQFTHKLNKQITLQDISLLMDYGVYMCVYLCVCMCVRSV